MSSLLSKRIHAARKTYGCDWCWQKILKGERYTYVAGVYEGDFTCARYHHECWDALTRSDNDDLEQGWTPGDFQRGKSVEES